MFLGSGCDRLRRDPFCGEPVVSVLDAVGLMFLTVATTAFICVAFVGVVAVVLCAWHPDVSGGNAGGE